MSSKVKQKLIYTDNQRDVALTGYVVEEDDFFITFESNNGRTYKIGKKAVVCLKPVEEL